VLSFYKNVLILYQKHKKYLSAYYCTSVLTTKHIIIKSNKTVKVLLFITFDSNIVLNNTFIATVEMIMKY